MMTVEFSLELEMEAKWPPQVMQVFSASYQFLLFVET